MSTTRTNCLKCSSDQLRWLTLRKGRIPVDVLQCQVCGTPNAEEDWEPPLAPLAPGHCWNCGHRRDVDRCGNCGLTRDEDVQVHLELRAIIHPGATHLEAARQASRMGRRLLALKLATAAAAINEHDQGEVARALRIWLLSAIGEPQHALDDAKRWVEGTQDPSAVAWASYGQQLHASNMLGAAVDAYDKALRKNQGQHNIRARKAQLMLELQRRGQAQDEALRVLAADGVDDQSAAIACQVAERLCDHLEREDRDQEIRQLLERTGAYLDRSPGLLAHQARLMATKGDLGQARRLLKRARRINPELEIYERVERAMRPARSSWWRW
ncbi:MAG: zinc ribbon domain-containing protein [Myxococcota bacterium]